jgi:hypothetical protein
MRAKSRRQFSAEHKTRIVLEKFRKETHFFRSVQKRGLLFCSVLFPDQGLCGGRESPSEAGKPSGDAMHSEVSGLRADNGRLKELVGEQALQLQHLKKGLNP